MAGWKRLEEILNDEQPDSESTSRSSVCYADQLQLEKTQHAITREQLDRTRELLAEFESYDGQPDLWIVLKRERDEAINKSKRLNALLRAIQADAEKYLIPDNDCSQEWFVNRVLWHVDGPEQRAAQSA